MEKAATRGQPRALAAIASMVTGSVPHAVLLVGPASSGKTTLALDLAAGLLCSDPDPTARPCRLCRGCRLVASGNHPDLHRLAPEGPGGQVRIGKAADPESGTIRRLISELALLPAEGGSRVAIVEQAHRINDDAQNALLKMLEEPPAGVTIVLCADDEECLLPTVRSRCVRIRLGPVAGREIERWLGELGAAEAPAASRFARLAGGCPGLALTYARAPEAARLRGEIARGLIDLLAAGRHERLTSVRSLMRSAAALEAALAEGRKNGAGDGESSGGADTPATSRRRKKGTSAAVQPAGDAEGEADSDGGGNGDGNGARASGSGTGKAVETAAPKVPASERRAAASALMSIWASVARDLAVAALGGRRQLHDPELLDELTAVAPTIAPGTLPAFIARLAAIEVQLGENVNPELALDVLALAWPRPGRAA
jgi:DNA polymerase III delta' subunit